MITKATITKTINQQIEVMKAFSEGKRIEFKTWGSDSWELTDVPVFNWAACDYRVLEDEFEDEFTPYTGLRVEIVTESNSSQIGRFVRAPYDYDEFNWILLDVNDEPVVNTYWEEDEKFQLHFQYRALDGVKFSFTRLVK